LSRVFIATSLLAGLLFGTFAAADEAAVTVTWEAAGASRTAIGHVLLEDSQGGILLLERTGELRTIPATQLKSRAAAAEFRPFDADELSESLRREFGDRFSIIRTKHYVICTDAGARFGEWTGKLFERLFDGFQTAWKDSGLELREPLFPMPVLIFAREQDYRDYAQRDIGPIAVDLGYYSSQTNRIALRDLTPAKDREKPGDLSGLVDAANVTTIVHEATHQIAFNTGFHVRLADNPMWLTEGLAMYFESPDLKNASGWKTTGQINRGRLQQYRDYSRNRRQPGSIETLVTGNERLSRPETAADAYAESWLLTHFLIRQRREQYVSYIQKLQTKGPLDFGTPESRLAEFREAFGDDLGRLEKQFSSYAARMPR
jgi:hypothetical protein